MKPNLVQTVITMRQRTIQNLESKVLVIKHSYKHTSDTIETNSAEDIIELWVSRYAFVILSTVIVVNITFVF